MKEPGLCVSLSWASTAEADLTDLVGSVFCFASPRREEIEAPNLSHAEPGLAELCHAQPCDVLPCDLLGYVNFFIVRPGILASWHPDIMASWRSGVPTCWLDLGTLPCPITFLYRYKCHYPSFRVFSPRRRVQLHHTPSHPPGKFLVFSRETLM